MSSALAAAPSPRPSTPLQREVAGGEHWPTGRSAFLADGGVEVTTLDLDAGSVALDELTAVLSTEERKRADRFAFDRDRRRFVTGRAALRGLLARRLGLSPADIELSRGPWGKPSLAPALASCGLRFNVSHCDGVAVVAFTREREVGIDVERIREFADADAIAERCFSPREWDAYRALAPGDRARAFFDCWTRKEAFVKALGVGLNQPLHAFDVLPSAGEPPVVQWDDGLPGGARRWRVECFQPLAGYVAAVVFESGRTADSDSPAPSRLCAPAIDGATGVDG